MTAVLQNEPRCYIKKQCRRYTERANSSLEAFIEMLVLLDSSDTGARQPFKPPLDVAAETNCSAVTYFPPAVNFVRHTP